jgi:hypothetical protein
MSPATRKPWVLLGAVVVLLGVGGGLAWWRHLAPVDPKLLSNEARIQVLLLCEQVQSYQEEHGTFLAAGPVPAQAPPRAEEVPFIPDENFKKLGFDPGERVRLQYQVVVQENPLGQAEVTCLVRADRNGDGQVSVYRVTLDANGMTSAVQVEREEE